MEKTYEPKNFENKIYTRWLENGYFDSDNTSTKPKYSILMPPPNITGRLHLGHAMNNSVSDIMARYKRMNGFNVEYLPGTDHAAIATEAKVVSKLQNEGKKKEDLTREQFEEEIQKWYKEYSEEILSQLKVLGYSADWKRLSFTRDEPRNKAVNHAFVELWKRGLIYKGERLTNWCPNCNTALSDIEVIYEDKKSKLYYIKYYLENSKTEYLIVATTRPETLFGDLAVAVNPKDKRYKNFVGKNVILPIINKAIPVIADDYVDMNFGTGALKITPSHDINDYNIGKKYNLGFNQVIEKNGELNEQCAQFKGLKGLDARTKVAEYLDKIGLLEKMEDYENKVGCCERCKTPVESLITEQWYVSMKEIAKKTEERIEKKEVNIVPESAKKRIYEWLNHIEDWCISRQLWSGHRIPIYYCQDCGNIYASENMCECPKCHSKNIIQDEDVLATWFSSGIWPISTLGWPQDAQDLKTYYPFDLVASGYDILTFWIARMLFMCIELTGVTPLKNVVVTGLIRDGAGRKMSKNLGNGVDPELVANEIGADALRIALIYGSSLVSDNRYDDSKLDTARKFINKVWNASRFVEMNLKDKEILPLDKCKLQLADIWILSELNDLLKKLGKLFDKFNLEMALTEIYDFTWYKFCDYYIEFSKPNMQSNDSEIVNTTASVLKYVLGNILKMLHPFAPFVTEEIYTNLFDEETIMFSPWAKYDKKFVATKEKEQMLSIMELTRSIRNIRTEYKCEPKKTLNVKMLVRKTKVNLEENIIYIQKLTNTKITVVENESTNKNDMLISSPYYLLYLDGSELIDLDEEKARLNAEISKAVTEIERLTKLLNNQGFIAKAPNQVIEKYNKDLAELKDKQQTLNSSLQKLNS